MKRAKVAEKNVVSTTTLARKVGGGILLLCVLVAGSAGSAEKEPTVVTAQGVAVVLQGNLDVARDAALQDALRQAVEQVVGTMVESDTLVQNFQLVSTNIYTRTRGYVQSYKVLSERQEGTLYKVSVQAVVDIGNLEKDLGALGLLYQRLKKPRVMVIIPETHIGMRPPDPAGETEIIRQLIQKGFKVVDQTQVRKIREGDQVKKALEGDVKAAQLLGQQHGAEVLIMGEAFSEGAMRGGVLANMVSVRARLEARAIRTDTGEILAADGAFAPGLDISEQIAGKKALAAAGGKWVETTLPVILDRWSKEVSGDNSVQLVITGLSFSQLAKFKEVLTQQVRGVKDLQQRSFIANVATLDVDLKGSTQAIADELMLKNFAAFKVEVTGFSPNRIDLRVVPQ